MGRPWYMNYEFVVRTSDNVELNLSMSFFWSLENIAYMIRNTDDAPGDICHHARSEIIQAVSKVTLKDFMENFNQIIHQTILESNAWIKKSIVYCKRSLKKVRIVSIVYNWLKVKM